jgi:uncharacterized repeat protein (TIGR01451 family)
MRLFLKTLVSLGSMAMASAAFAASPIQLSSDIYVEKVSKKADGSSAVTLVAPNTVLPGDQLIFVVHYKNAGSQAAEGFVVTNPIPRSISFSGTSDGTEIVSVDGGKSWGEIEQLRVSSGEGRTRPALMTDVTHVKWKLTKSLAAGAAGKLIFRGTVK